MDESDICKDAVYSEAYADYILDTSGNIELFRRTYAPDCLQQVDGSFVVMYNNIQTNGIISFEKYGYGAVPKCFGLCDTQSVEATGALRLRRRGAFELDGTGVLVGIVDTGIDYTNPLFQYADGSTRIQYIWNQEDRTGNSPQGIIYGTEYTREDINEALQSESPKEWIPVDDLSYHGSFLAAIAAGNDRREDDFTGVAPRAELVVVKVKSAKQNLRQFYGIDASVPCFQENDIMMGMRYLWEKAALLRKPIVILLGMGSNSGSHSGLSPIGNMINRLGNLSGICIVGAAGNETNMGHHYYEMLGGKEEDVVELNVEKDTAMTLEVWTDAIGALSVGIVSPDGEFSGRIPIRTYEQRIEFVFQKTTIYVFYERVEYYSGEEVIILRMQDLENGIWKIHVANLEEDETGFHIWMPMREFVENSRFLRPNPDTIVCNPGNSYQIVTTAAYDHRDDSIFVNSSRGFTASFGIKPDLAAPGVNVFGPTSELRYGYRSGTSIAAAHTAGVSAMLLQWGIVQQNNLAMNTVTVKNYLIRGARRQNLVIPDRSFGWGILDIYNTFESLKTY